MFVLGGRLGDLGGYFSSDSSWFFRFSVFGSSAGVLIGRWYFSSGWPF